MLLSDANKTKETRVKQASKVYLSRSTKFRDVLKRVSKGFRKLFFNRFGLASAVSESIRSIYSNRAVTYSNRAVIVHLYN